MGVDEILVHISGPSSRRDDLRLRELARAYETYEPARITRIPGEATESSMRSEQITSPERLARASAAATSSTLSEVPAQASRPPKRSGETLSESAVREPNQVPATPVYIDDTQLARAAIESQLWAESFVDNGIASSSSWASPLAGRARKKARHSLDGDLDDEKFLTALSQVSHTERPGALAKSPPGPIRVLREHVDMDVRTSTSLPLASKESNVKSSLEQGTLGPLDSKNPEDATEGRMTEGPEDGNNALVAANNSAAQMVAMSDVQQTSLDGHSSVDLVASTPLNIEGEAAAVREAVLETDPVLPDIMPETRTGQRLSTQVGKGAIQKAPLEPPVSRLWMSASIQNSGQSADQIRSTTSIMPSLPKISLQPSPILDESTIVTQALLKLNSSPALSSTYQPSHQSRELRQLERGHWRFNTSEWDSEIREGTWTFLDRFVCQGRGGWGLWCTRSAMVLEERDSSGPAVSTFKGHDAETGDNGIANAKGDDFRVYTWGSTTPHVYRLLYVASKSKIKRCKDVEWVDAGGQVVVRI